MSYSKFWLAAIIFSGFLVFPSIVVGEDFQNPQAEEIYTKCADSITFLKRRCAFRAARESQLSAADVRLLWERLELGEPPAELVEEADSFDWRELLVERIDGNHRRIIVPTESGHPLTQMLTKALLLDGWEILIMQTSPASARYQLLVYQDYIGYRNNYQIRYGITIVDLATGRPAVQIGEVERISNEDLVDKFLEELDKKTDYPDQKESLPDLLEPMPYSEAPITQI